MLAKDKRISFLWKFVNYGHKKFYNIGTWAIVIKQYSVVILSLLFLGLMYRSNLLPLHSFFQGNIAL